MGSLLDWKRAEKKLAEGNIVIMPCDTVYGILGRADLPKIVENIYKIKKRNKNKPFIILISSLNDLKNFRIELNQKQEKFIKRIWPGKISVIFYCDNKKLNYLHRGKNSLAFRLVETGELKELIDKVGPLVAPSANLEKEKTVSNIEEAQEVFNSKINFYLDGGELVEKPSTLIDLTSKKICIMRKGQDYWRCFFYSKML
jgi:L-threonylcarbamoyladenylate synthase